MANKERLLPTVRKRLTGLIYCTNDTLDTMALKMGLKSHQGLRLKLGRYGLPSDVINFRKEEKKAAISMLVQDLLILAYIKGDSLGTEYRHLINDIRNISNVGNSRSFDDKLEFWSKYVELEDRDELTTTNMVREVSWLKSPGGVNGPVTRAGLPRVNSKKAAPKRPRKKLFALEEIVLKSTLPSNDIAYFYMEHRGTISAIRKKYGYSGPLLGPLDERICRSTFGNVSMIYEARSDAKMGMNQISELLKSQVSKQNIQKILGRRDVYSGLIIDELKILFPTNLVNVPWVTKPMREWYSANFGHYS